MLDEPLKTLVYLEVTKHHVAKKCDFGFDFETGQHHTKYVLFTYQTSSACILRIATRIWYTQRQCSKAESKLSTDSSFDLSK